MEIKIDPCPKCEMEDIEVVEVDGWKTYWRVVCLNCGHEGTAYPIITEAVKNWNEKPLDKAESSVIP